MRGVKFGASGSNARVRSASANDFPAARKSQIVSVWSPLVTTSFPACHRTGA